MNHMIPVILAIAGLTGLIVPRAEEKLDSERAANLVLLDEAGEKTLGIQTVEAIETTFEETAFSLGRIEEIAEKHAVLSSRISGRVIEVAVRTGDMVKKDQVLVRLESRQPGDPPPIIELRAPISGLVMESHVKIGEPVEPDSEIMDIVDLSLVYAVARVPEHLAGRLQAGSKAHIRVSAAGGSTTVTGELARLGTSADTASGTMEALFQLPNPDMKIRPGMRAEFDLVLGSHENVLCVPREAVQGDPSSRHVYVKDFELPHAYLRTPVKTGRTNGRQIEILSGVFPADMVVTTGSYSLGFAGSSGVSLREALDAAHGHKHNEDGSEASGDEPAAAASTNTAPGAPGAGTAPGLREMFFMGTTALLLALLLAQSFRRGHRGASQPERK